MIDKLPENVIQLSTYLRSTKPKKCQCYKWVIGGDKRPQFSIDFNNREIICEHCGNAVDPFEAFEVLLKDQEETNREMRQLYQQAKELMEYKPWLISIKELESQMRSGKYVPYCPHCRKEIDLKQLSFSTRRKKELLK